MSTSDPKYFLIVEDEMAIREIVVELLGDLSHLGMTIIQAENGQEGLAMVEKYNPLAIMSDIGMPIMTGLEFLTELRQKGYETPFLVLSAFGDRANTIKALRLGAFDFIDKPFDENHLLTTVTNIFNLGLELRQIDHEIQSSIESGKSTAHEALTQGKARKLRAIMHYQHPSKKQA